MRQCACSFKSSWCYLFLLSSYFFSPFVIWNWHLINPQPFFSIYFFGRFLLISLLKSFFLLYHSMCEISLVNCEVTFENCVRSCHAQKRQNPSEMAGVQGANGMLRCILQCGCSPVVKARDLELRGQKGERGRKERHCVKDRLIETKTVCLKHVSVFRDQKRTRKERVRGWKTQCELVW